METNKFKEMVKVVNDIEVLAKQFKITNQQVISKVLTMSMRNEISKDKAKAMLKGTNALKLVDVPRKSGLSKPLPNTNEKVKTTFC
jgi:hypothetical protein